jgi:hypothetical protein
MLKAFWNPLGVCKSHNFSSPSGSPWLGGEAYSINEWEPRFRNAPLTHEPDRAVTLGRLLVLTWPNFNDLFTECKTLNCYYDYLVIYPSDTITITTKSTHSRRQWCTIAHNLFIDYDPNQTDNVVAAAATAATIAPKTIVIESSS